MSDDTDNKDQGTSSKKRSHRPFPSVEMILLAGLTFIGLDYFLGWGLFPASRLNRTRNQISQVNQPAIGTGPAAIRQQPNRQASQTIPRNTLQVTHHVVCNNGNQGLNFRPTAGFSTPLFAMPCGAAVAVTGSAVIAQNETWSPVIYANRSGWAATKLLAPIR